MNERYYDPSFARYLRDLDRETAEDMRAPWEPDDGDDRDPSDETDDDCDGEEE